MKNDRLLRACRCEPVDSVPVWFMRQAGRYQPEYRQLRQKYSLLQICEHPDVCAEVTMLPVRQLGTDAAILFSDIMVPIAAMGVSLEIQENVGPVIEHPVRSLRDVDMMHPLEVTEGLPHVLESIKILVRELDVPLIGFAGGPFTLASYLVEGRPSRDYRYVKTLMYTEPSIWHRLMESLSTMVASYLVAQIQAGCQVVQVFDSWVGNLNLPDYERYVKPYMFRILDAVRQTAAPLIYFGLHTGHLLESMATVGSNVIGVDWKEEIDKAWERVGPACGVQGNLDPVVLFAPPSVVEEKVQDILRRTAGRDGYIFNLGHGVLPNTDIGSLQRVVEMVHRFGTREDYHIG